MRVRAVLVGIVAALLCACDSHQASPAPTTATTPLRPGLVSYSLGSATIKAPARWIRTPYRGAPAPVVLPEFFLNTFPLPDCQTGYASRGCTTQNWFPPRAVTPKSGLIVMWVDIQFPTDNLDTSHGDPTQIDGHVAQLYVGTATERCPSATGSEIDAAVRKQPPEPRPRYISGERYDMIACLGPKMSADDKSAVLAMLDSLHFKR